MKQLPQVLTICINAAMEERGGEAALFKDRFQCKEISFGDFTSFEYLKFDFKGRC